MNVQRNTMIPRPGNYLTRSNPCNCNGNNNSYGIVARQNQTDEQWTPGRIGAGVVGVALSFAIPVGLWAWGYWAGKRAKR